MATIWRTRDRFDRAVTLTDDRRAHILSRHPQLVGRESEIRTAVESPDFVTRSAQDPHCEVCYRRPAPNRARTRVVVCYVPSLPDGTWAELVITAHPAETVDPKEVPVWP